MLRAEEKLFSRKKFGKLKIIAENDSGINSGVYFIRNCEWSKKFLHSVYGRTDCLTHHYPEQQAIALELKNPAFSDLSKIVSPRFFNGLPPEFLAPDYCNYHPGDFLVHFASANGQGRLVELFQKYAPLVSLKRIPISLNQYLNQKGFYLSPMHSAKNEGYMSDAQKEQFQDELKLRPEVESILEIGLNGGHSAENFFRFCKGLKKFVSFDINHHAYTPVAVEYFKLTYPARFEFIPGDSMKTVPEYCKKFRDQKFDLIYIDGGHSYDLCLNDILNCKWLAHRGTHVWIDDYGSPVIQQAVAAAENQRVIHKKNIYRTFDKQYGERCWIEVEYQFPKNS